MASAKFAKTTVNQSHSVTCTVKSKWPVLPEAMSRKMRSVVRRLPISTTNMTGLPATCRGLSFMNESLTARLTIFGSKRGLLCAFSAITTPDENPIAKLEREDSNQLKRCSRIHQKVLYDRAQRQHGEESQRAHDKYHADQKRDEKARGTRERARGRRHDLLGRKISGYPHHRYDHQESPDQHRQPQGRVVPVRIDTNSGEGGAVVACSGGVSVDDLRE